MKNVVKINININTSMTKSKNNFDNDSGEKFADYLNDIIDKSLASDLIKVYTEKFGPLSFNIDIDPMISPFFQLRLNLTAWIDPDDFSNLKYNDLSRLEEDLATDVKFLNVLNQDISEFIEKLNNLLNIKHPISSDFIFKDNCFYIKTDPSNFEQPEFIQFEINKNILPDHIASCLSIL